MPIALLTDFGTRDPYVAAMKGVLAARTGEPIHDLTHEIDPYDVVAASWFLRSVERYWPEGTIFVSVVDPGVGTAREIVVLEAAGRRFIAPDNGLLTFIVRLSAAFTARAVTNESLFLPAGSNTFHGRDRFAPVAAALANGLPLVEVGPEIERLVLLPYEPPEYGTRVVSGTIVAIDRFGNAITDIECARIPFPRFMLRTGDVTITRLEQNYGDAAPGSFLIEGSTGSLEISVARASAASQLGLKKLDRVEILAHPV
jgi:S-adenosyl-L-methionine hydrolase (adenosine-forming)